MAVAAYPCEAEARRDIVEAGRRLYQRGLICAGDGNLSARLSDTEVLATPSGVSKGFLTEDMLVKLRLDGGTIENGAKPSSEIKMHLEIYKKSPDIFAVCHAHPPVASVFAAEGVPLDRAVLQETVMLLGVIPVAPYAAPGSDALAKSAASFCRDYHGVLLEQHGAAAWGGSVMQALFRMESIEFTAAVTMHAKMLGFTRTLNNAQIAELTALRTNWGITAELGKFS